MGLFCVTIGKYSSNMWLLLRHWTFSYASTTGMMDDIIAKIPGSSTAQVFESIIIVMHDLASNGYPLF